MKKLLVILLALSLFALMWALGGCSNDNDNGGVGSYSPSVQTDYPDDVPGEPGEVTEQFTDCTLKSRDGAERSDGDYTKVYEINCGGEYIEHHYLFCDAEMTGFRVVSVEMNEDGTFTQGSVYSQIESVKPGEAVYLTIELPEIIPNTAIVYTAGGTEYVWLAGYNGRDGGISLVPLGVNQLITGE